MKKVLLVAALIMVGLVAVFLILVAMQPAEFEVTRSTTIDAPPEAVFPYVNDLHRWNDWSPWAKLDPNATNTFSGPEQGEGASFHWSGNAEVGEGSMTIIESRPHEYVGIDLRFIKPFEDQAGVTFELEPVADDRTEVVWSMAGKNNFIGRVFCLIMDMEKIVGGEYEKGLANLKTMVETAQAEPDGDADLQEQPAEEDQG